MYSLTLDSFVDADRRNPSHTPGTGKPSVRTWLAVAFVVWVAVWLVFRLNDYFGLLR